MEHTNPNKWQGQYVGFTSNDYEEKWRKNFYEMLTQIINSDLLPRYGQELKKFSVELGLFTSDQYGSYRIPFYNVDDSEVCYIVADTIMGEWKVFEIKK